MASKDSDLHRPRGSLAVGRWSVHLDPETAGWTWTSLRVLTLAPGESQRLETGPQEMLVLPLAGSCAVTCGGERIEPTGRASVFRGLSDFAYLPRGRTPEVARGTGGRVGLPRPLAARGLRRGYGPPRRFPRELC